MQPADLARRALQMTRRRVDRLLDRELHRRFGGDLGGLEYLDDLGVEGEGRVYYQPSIWLPTSRAFRRLGMGPADVFADVGAGKGVAVLLAAEHPVRRVLGVELSSELAATARRNVEGNRRRLNARSVEIVTSDVLTWEIPDDLTIVFLYNPFVGEVFQLAMERLFAAYDRHPRPLRIVYSYPWEHNWLISTGRVQAVDVASGLWPRARSWWRLGEVIVTYTVGTTNGQGPRGRPAPPEALAYWNAPNETRFYMQRPGQPVTWSS